MRSIFALFLAAAVCFPAYSDTNSSSSELKDSKVVSGYNYKDFAEYLGLTVQEYHRFSQAYAPSNSSPLLPQFIDILNHPKFIELQALTNAGEVAPDSLNVEVEALFHRNQETFAEYMDMSVSELENLQTKYDELIRVISQLEGTVNLSSESLGKETLNEDDVEYITIQASEDKIEETSSGTRTQYTTVIYNFGMGLSGGNGVYFIVDFYRSSGSYYGSQQWYVDRFRVYPTGNIFCSPELCSLNPY